MDEIAKDLGLSRAICYRSMDIVNKLEAETKDK
jgi:hypothetical protein